MLAPSISLHRFFSCSRGLSPPSTPVAFPFSDKKKEGRGERLALIVELVGGEPAWPARAGVGIKLGWWLIC